MMWPYSSLFFFSYKLILILPVMLASKEELRSLLICCRVLSCWYWFLVLFFLNVCCSLVRMCGPAALFAAVCFLLWENTPKRRFTILIRLKGVVCRPWAFILYKHYQHPSLGLLIFPSGSCTQFLGPACSVFDSCMWFLFCFVFWDIVSPGWP